MPQLPFRAWLEGSEGTQASRAGRNARLGVKLVGQSNVADIVLELWRDSNGVDRYSVSVHKHAQRGRGGGNTTGERICKLIDSPIASLPDGRTLEAEHHGPTVRGGSGWRASRHIDRDGNETIIPAPFVPFSPPNGPHANPVTDPRLVREALRVARYSDGESARQAFERLMADLNNATGFGQHITDDMQAAANADGAALIPTRNR